ncbi:LysR family transcriptional regulator [Paraburkholderia bengalensis]|uniref:LysR family transcriptional regulator n=1 Tax=Paraburkholderia bengalensis TaxID=2747562 RepID=A0ABU8J5I7_9BURK
MHAAGFTKAGRELCISQPSVSRQICELERTRARRRS